MAGRIIIYSNPRKNQSKEELFLKVILNNCSNAILIKESYRISQTLIDNRLLNIRLLEKRISLDRQLTTGNKSHLLNELSALPDLIKIAIPQGHITSDMAIKANGQIKLIEFNEQQHRSLSIKKLRDQKYFVCSTCDIPIEVPRSIQRFLRDIWRVQNLQNLSIVWWDWFDINKAVLTLDSLFSENKVEYNLPNKFSFSQLLGKLSDTT